MKEPGMTNPYQGVSGGVSAPLPILRYFAWIEVSPEKQFEINGIRAKFLAFAEELDRMILNCPEKEAGLRKLLEAKDCFVRAAL